MTENIKLKEKKKTDLTRRSRNVFCSRLISTRWDLSFIITCLVRQTSWVVLNEYYELLIKFSHTILPKVIEDKSRISIFSHANIILLKNHWLLLKLVSSRRIRLSSSFVCLHSARNVLTNNPMNSSWQNRYIYQIKNITDIITEYFVLISYHIVVSLFCHSHLRSKQKDWYE